MFKCIRDWLRRLLVRRPKLTDDQQWEAWQKLIRRIYQETVYAFKSRMIWREVHRIYEANQELQAEGIYFLEWMRGVYARDQAMAIRREADRGSDVLNLVQLMFQISRHPEVISRARYKAHFHPDTVIPEPLQDSQFNDLCGTGAYIDAAMVKRHYRRLLKDCRPVVNYVNKRIADRTDAEVDLTMKQVHTAMDAVEEVRREPPARGTCASIRLAARVHLPVDSAKGRSVERVTIPAGVGGDNRRGAAGRLDRINRALRFSPRRSQSSRSVTIGLA